MNLALVTDALRERGTMLRNAPHLVHRLNFVVPLYSYSAIPYYGIGLKIYEKLSGGLSLGPSELLSIAETMERLPTLRKDGLKGGILYRDGQFDDARYAIALVRTLEDLGGVAVNYADVTGLIQTNGRVTGVAAVECESCESFDVHSQVVINATGVFAEEVFRMDPGHQQVSLAVSQGSHLVLPKTFLSSNDALMIPKTEDGRVLFAIPWHEHLVVGTTDEAVPHSSREPRATAEEGSFLMRHASRYLCREITAGDVLSVWAGLRPLLRKGNAATSKLSRDHQVLRSPSGLITITGGKWTTYRKMGEDTISLAVRAAGLRAAESRTHDLKLHGWTDRLQTGSDMVYGADLPALDALTAENPELSEPLHSALPYRRREVIWAARHEHARTTEDVLARRTRSLFLNASAAMEAAPEVSRLLARELARDDEWRKQDLGRFLAIAEGYKFAG
jgi:glycerol-3-phosphate dehydrogenase